MATTIEMNITSSDVSETYGLVWASGSIGWLAGYVRDFGLRAGEFTLQLAPASNDPADSWEVVARNHDTGVTVRFGNPRLRYSQADAERSANLLNAPGWEAIGNVSAYVRKVAR